MSREKRCGRKGNKVQAVRLCVYVIIIIEITKTRKPWLGTKLRPFARADRSGLDRG